MARKYACIQDALRAYGEAQQIAGRGFTTKGARDVIRTAAAVMQLHREESGANARRAALDAQALEAIADILSGTEWDADTCDAIAQRVRLAGYTINEPEEG